jgi:imidazolonepropionase-like amidohydrolase
VAREVMLLATHGLTPTQALAAATTTAHRFLNQTIPGTATPGCVVTYDTDPREDPAALSAPRAVLMNGQRIR